MTDAARNLVEQASAIVREESARPIRVVNFEHKTTSKDIGPASSYWKGLVIDGQVSTYDTGVRVLGFEPTQTLYDVIRKPQMRPLEATPPESRKYTEPKSKACPECKKKKATPAPHTIDGVTCADGRIVTDPGGKLYANMREQDETPSEFAARLRKDIAENPDKYFQRGVIVRTRQELTDASRDAWHVGVQILESRRLHRWPRNPEACESFGSFCEYWDVCTRTISVNDSLRFRTAEHSHEELVVDEKRRLPILSISAMKAYRSCQQKFYLRYELRRRPVVEKDVLRFGTLMHRGLEVWWSTVDLDRALAAMRASYSGLKVDQIEAIKAEQLMIGYHVRWKDEPLEVLAVEQQFVAPLVDPDSGNVSDAWELGGKIDAIVRAPE